MKKIDKRNLIFNLISIVFSAVYIALGCIPSGIRMDFFGGFVEYHPYFSGMPYGYGNVFPLFIEILAIVNIILLVISIFISKKGLQVTKIVFPSIILVFCFAEFFFTNFPTAINIAMFDIAFAHVMYEVIAMVLTKNNRQKARKYPTYTEFCNEYGLDSSDSEVQKVSIEDMTDDD